MQLVALDVLDPSLGLVAFGQSTVDQSTYRGTVIAESPTLSPGTSRFCFNTSATASLATGTRYSAVVTVVSNCDGAKAVGMSDGFLYDTSPPRVDAVYDSCARKDINHHLFPTLSASWSPPVDDSNVGMSSGVARVDVMFTPCNQLSRGADALVIASGTAEPGATSLELQPVVDLVPGSRICAKVDGVEEYVSVAFDCFLGSMHTLQKRHPRTFLCIGVASNPSFRSTSVVPVTQVSLCRCVCLVVLPLGRCPLYCDRSLS